MLGVSLGAGPALLAATDPSVSSDVSARARARRLRLGGGTAALHADRRLSVRRRSRAAAPSDEPAIAQFARANAELLDGASRRLVDNRDPAALDGLVAELTRRTRAGCSPRCRPTRVIGRLRAPLFLDPRPRRPGGAVHREPAAGSETRARLAGRTSAVVIVGSLGHVEPEWSAGLRRSLPALGGLLCLPGRAATRLTSAGRAS